MKSTYLNTLIVSLAFALSFILVFPSTAIAHENQKADAKIETRLLMRDLWVEHVFWVRNYVLANQIQDTAARKEAAIQVVDNAKAIAASIKPLYGDDASKTLLNLLAGHWTSVKDYSDAAVNGSDADKKAALNAMSLNANRIAEFLSTANPYLPKKTLSSLLMTHGSHHVEQIEQISAEQYTKEAVTWAKMREHMHVIADSITAALIKQFPEKF